MQDRNREGMAQSGAEADSDLAAALEEAKAKAAKYLGKWQRTEADFDNYRKRLEQEKSDTVKYANAALGGLDRVLGYRRPSP